MESVTMHLFIPSKMLLCMVTSPAFGPVVAFPGLSLKTVSTTAGVILQSNPEVSYLPTSGGSRPTLGQAPQSFHQRAPQATALPVTCCSPTAASVVLGMEAAGGNQSYNNCFHSTPVKSMVSRQGLAM